MQYDMLNVGQPFQVDFDVDFDVGREAPSRRDDEGPRVIAPAAVARRERERVPRLELEEM